MRTANQRSSFLLLLLVLLPTELLLLSHHLEARTLTDQVREMIRARIEEAGIPAKITVGEDPVLAALALPRFYENRSYQPAWVGDQGPLPTVESLRRAISQATGEGLRAEDYHWRKIVAILEELKENREKGKPRNLRRLVDLDLLLTDAFLIYGSHLLGGFVNPETIHPEWNATRREKDLVEVLQLALDGSQIEKTLKDLLPSHTGYSKLREALLTYRKLAKKADWSKIPAGPALKEGKYDERVTLLKIKLLASGDMEKELETDEKFFDDILDEAVRRFQKRHGLDIDGIVGPVTLAALNVPLSERVRQIELSLERWRWLPESLGERYLLVNIANFELEVVENNNLIMNMRAVVGRSYRSTPVFSDRVSYLVLSPYWHVPPSIASKDMLPLIQKEPDYFDKQGIKVFIGWGAEAKELDSKSIDWSKVTSKNFPYRLRQDPGAKNALGQVKFMFPNKFNVYLHDTPARELFQKAARGFSSGCIRIEKPIELSEYLLKGDPKWGRENVLGAIAKGIEQTVSLLMPIPIYLLYWTAWVDDDGQVHFREDIYGRDALLDQALQEKAPTN